MCRLAGRSAGDDRGAVIVLVAILLAAGVLSGLLALSVDVGRIYVERRVVQNAADSGSLAVAELCAEGDPLCASSAAASGTVSALANANSPDNATQVREVCGTSPLSPCTPLTGSSLDCQPVVDASLKYARVRTGTRTAGGQLFFPAIFAGLTGGSSENITVGACGQAAWGPVGTTMIIFPILLPDCAASLYVDQDVLLVEGKDSKGPSCGATKELLFGVLGATKDCTDQAPVTVGETIIGTTPSLTQFCGTKGENLLAQEVGKDVMVLISGPKEATKEYNVASFINFTLLGFKNQDSKNSYGTSPSGNWNKDCPKLTCMYGHFGKVVVPGDIDPDTPDYGVTAIELIP